MFRVLLHIHMYTYFLQEQARQSVCVCVCVYVTFGLFSVIKFVVRPVLHVCVCVCVHRCPLQLYAISFDLLDWLP